MATYGSKDWIQNMFYGEGLKDTSIDAVGSRRRWLQDTIQDVYTRLGGRAASGAEEADWLNQGFKQRGPNDFRHHDTRALEFIQNNIEKSLGDAFTAGKGDFTGGTLQQQATTTATPATTTTTTATPEATTTTAAPTTTTTTATPGAGAGGGNTTGTTLNSSAPITNQAIQEMKKAQEESMQQFMSNLNEQFSQFTSSFQIPKPQPWSFGTGLGGIASFQLPQLQAPTPPAGSQFQVPRTPTHNQKALNII